MRHDVAWHEMIDKPPLMWHLISTLFLFKDDARKLFLFDDEDFGVSGRGRGDTVRLQSRQQSWQQFRANKNIKLATAISCSGSRDRHYLYD